MALPQLIKGGVASDHRGEVTFNNNLDLTQVKRMYAICNKVGFKRGWQGHLVEQRWFTPMVGDFEIHLVHKESFEKLRDYHHRFIIKSKDSQTLYIPAGYMTCIQSLSVENKLLIFADYSLSEIEDECRFELGHFNIF